MSGELNLVLPPETAFDEAALKRYLSRRTGRSDFSILILRRSVDARRHDIKVNMTVVVMAPGEATEEIPPLHLRDVSHAREVLIAGI
jgi:hypothetical protein